MPKKGSGAKGAAKQPVKQPAKQAPKGTPKASPPRETITPAVGPNKDGLAGQARRAQER